MAKRFNYAIDIESMTMTETALNNKIHTLSIGNYMPLKYPDANNTIKSGMYTKIFVAKYPYVKNDKYTFLGKEFTVTNPKIVIQADDYIKANFDFEDLTVRLINLSRTEYNPTRIVTEEYFGYHNLCECTEETEIFNLPVVINSDSDVTFECNIACALREGNITARLYIDELGSDPVAVTQHSCNADINAIAGSFRAQSYQRDKYVNVSITHSLYKQDMGTTYSARVTVQFTPVDYVYTKPFEDVHTPRILVSNSSAIYGDNGSQNLSDTHLSIFAKSIEYNLPLYSVKIADLDPDMEFPANATTVLTDYDVYYRKIKNNTEIELYKVDLPEDKVLRPSASYLSNTWSNLWYVKIPEKIDNIPVTKLHDGLFQHMLIKKLWIPKYVTDVGTGLTMQHHHWGSNPATLDTLYYSEFPYDNDRTTPVVGSNSWFKDPYLDIYWGNTEVDNLKIGSIAYTETYRYNQGFPSSWTPTSIEAFTIMGSRKMVESMNVNSMPYESMSQYGSFSGYSTNTMGRYDYLRTLPRQITAEAIGTCGRYPIKDLLTGTRTNIEFGTGSPVSMFLSILWPIFHGESDIELTPGDQDFKPIDDAAEALVDMYATKYSGHDRLAYIDEWCGGRNVLTIPDSTMYIKKYAFNNLIFQMDSKYPTAAYKSRYISFSLRGHKFYYDPEFECYYCADGPGLPNGLGKNIRVVDDDAFYNCYIDQDLTIPNTARYISLTWPFFNMVDTAYMKTSASWYVSDVRDGQSERFFKNKPGVSGVSSKGPDLSHNQGASIFDAVMCYPKGVYTVHPNLPHNETRGNITANETNSYAVKSSYGQWPENSALIMPSSVPQVTYSTRHVLTIEEPVANAYDTEEHPRLTLKLYHWSQVQNSFAYKAYTPEPLSCDPYDFYESDNNDYIFYSAYKYLSGSTNYYTADTTYKVEQHKLLQLYDPNAPRLSRLRTVYETMVEPFVIPKYTTVSVDRLEADDLIFTDSTSELVLTNKFGTRYPIVDADTPSTIQQYHWAERSYLHLAKYRGFRTISVWNSSTYALELLKRWVLNTRSNFDSFCPDPTKSFPEFSVFSSNYTQDNYDGITPSDLVGTVPFYLANDNEVGVHYSMAGNVIADVIVYPREVDLGNISSEKPAGEFYGDNVFDPSSYDIEDNINSMESSPGRYLNTSDSSNTTLRTPAMSGITPKPNYATSCEEWLAPRVHGVTYLPNMPNSVFPPCRYFWTGQRITILNAKVIGWRSLSDVGAESCSNANQYTGLKCTSSSKTYNPAGYYLYQFDQLSTSSSSVNFHSKYNTYNNIADATLRHYIDIRTNRKTGDPDFGSCGEEYNDAKRFSRSMSYLYLTQGTETIRTDAIGIFPNLYRSTDADAATIFFPPSLKTIEAGAIKASNYVWYVPTGCTVGQNYTTDSIKTIIRTREYRSNGGIYSAAVTIKNYDASNNMTSHYTFADGGNESSITAFAASPSTAPYQRKSIGTYLMPSTHSGLPVKHLASIFSSDDDVRSVVGEVFVSTNLTEIPDNCFQNCQRLFRTQIPANVTTIGDHAYEKCLHMYDLDCTATNITSIGDYAFAYCGSHNLDEGDKTLSDLGYTIDHMVRRTSGYSSNYSKYMKDPCAPNLAEHKIDISHCTYIGEYAFFNSNMLSGVVTLPSGLTTIKAGTFAYCGSITKIIIPASVTTIEHDAFSHMVSLEEITIPSTVVTANLSFDGCVRLKKVIVEDGGHTTISVAAHGFRNCISLTECDLHGVRGSIGAVAFDNFGINVRSMDLYCSSLGEEAFVFCGVESITFHENCNIGAIARHAHNAPIPSGQTYATIVVSNTSIKDIFVDTGVTLTVNTDKNLYSMFRTFPVANCVGIKPLYNNENTLECCTFADVEATMDFEHPTNGMLKGFGGAILPSYAYGFNRLNRGYESQKYTYVPFIIPDAHWIPEQYQNFCDGGTWVNGQIYIRFLPIKQSVYNGMSDEARWDLFNFAPITLTAGYTGDNLTSAALTDTTGMLTKMMNDGGVLSTPLKSLSRSEFEYSSVSVVTLDPSANITQIPNNCFLGSCLCEESMQAMIDNPAIVKYNSLCFAEGDITNGKPGRYSSAQGTLVFNKRNANGEIVDRNGNLREDIAARYNYHINFQLPSEDERWYYKERSGSGSTTDPYVYNYPTSYTAEDIADDKAKSNAMLNKYLTMYKRSLMEPLVATALDAYQISSQFSLDKDTQDIMTAFSAKLTDIYTNGTDSEYAEDFIVIPLSGSIYNDLPVELDLSSKPITATSNPYDSDVFAYMKNLVSVDLTNWTSVKNTRLFARCQKYHPVIPLTVKEIKDGVFEDVDFWGDYEFDACNIVKTSMTASWYSRKDIGTITCWDCVGPTLMSTVPNSYLYNGELDDVSKGKFVWRSRSGDTATVAFDADYDFSFGPEIVNVIVSGSNIKGCPRFKDVIFPAYDGTDINTKYITFSNICSDSFVNNWDFKDLEILPKLSGTDIQAEEFFSMTNGQSTSESARRSLSSSYSGARVQTIKVNSPWIPPYWISNIETLTNITLGNKVKKIGEGFCCWCYWVGSWGTNSFYDVTPANPNFEFTFPNNADLALGIHDTFKYTKAKKVDMTHVKHLAMSNNDLYNDVYTDGNLEILSTEIGAKRQICAYVKNLILPSSPVIFPQSSFAIWDPSNAIAKEVNMETVDINGVEHLPNYAFTDQSKLTTVSCSTAATVTLGTEGDSTTVSRNHKCFYNCKSLVTFPFAKLRGRIGFLEFANNEKLTTASDLVFSGITACTGYGTYDPSISDTSDAETNPTTPNKSSAFYNCGTISKLWFDNTCTFTAIGTYFACSCTALREVKVPPTCMYIGYKAFDLCTLLGRLYVPTGCTVDPTAIFLNTTVVYYDPTTGEYEDPSDHTTKKLPDFT